MTSFKNSLSCNRVSSIYLMAPSLFFIAVRTISLSFFNLWLAYSIVYPDFFTAFNTISLSSFNASVPYIRVKGFFSIVFSNISFFDSFISSTINLSFMAIKKSIFSLLVFNLL